MSQQTISNPHEFHRNISRLNKPQDMGLPSLENFNIDDIKKIREKKCSTLANLSPEDKLFTLLKVPIKKKYLTKLEEDNEMHHNLFVFFLRYLVYLQKFEPHQKIYLLALEIDEYKDLKKLKYEFLPGLENIYNKFEELKDFEYLVYIIRIDGRWVIEILRIRDKKPFLIDFISPMLRNVNHVQLHSIISKIHHDLYEETLIEDYNLLNKLISREINDYSIYVCFITYYVTMNQDWNDVKENIGNFSEHEMKSFINKILWIIYTILMRNCLLNENAKTNNNISKITSNYNHSPALKPQTTLDSQDLMSNNSPGLNHRNSSYKQFGSNNNPSLKNQSVIHSPELNHRNSSNKLFGSNNHSSLKHQSVIDSPGLNPHRRNSSYKQCDVNRHSSLKHQSVIDFDSLTFKKPLENNAHFSISKKTIVDLLKQMKKEILEEVTKKKTYSDLDKFINEELSDEKLHHLDDFHLKFSKNELKEILLKYGEKFKEQKSTKINELHTKEFEYCQNYNNFISLLNYYYYYDSDMYKNLINEYNDRLQNQLLMSLGLPPKPQIITTVQSKKKYIPQYNVSIKTKPNYYESMENTGKSRNSKNYRLVRKKSSIKNDSDNQFLLRRPSQIEMTNPSYLYFSKTDPSQQKVTKHRSMHHKNNDIENNPQLLKVPNNNRDSNVSRTLYSHHNNKSENPSSQKLLSNIFQSNQSFNGLSNINLTDIHVVKENTSKLTLNPKQSHNNTPKKSLNNSPLSINPMKKNLFLGDNNDEKLPLIDVKTPNVKTPNARISPGIATTKIINNLNTYGL